MGVHLEAVTFDSVDALVLADPEGNELDIVAG
jgi:hypothetical protein